MRGFHYCIQGIKLEGKLPPESKLMVQPPADHSLGKAALCHYTWGSIFKDKNDGDREVWKFDKRFYTAQDVALKVSIKSRCMPSCCCTVQACL
jgi:hypothetical protein